MLVALDNPLDQYYMRHPDVLLGKPSENALLDPDNVYILQRHLPCAAHESQVMPVIFRWVMRQILFRLW